MGLHGISGENLGTYDKATAEALQNLIAFKNGTHVDKPPTNTTVENDSQETSEKSTRSSTPETKSQNDSHDFVSVESVDNSKNDNLQKNDEKEEWADELKYLKAWDSRTRSFFEHFLTRTKFLILNVRCLLQLLLF